MKNLILVRHGKSSWDYNVDDKDRSLKERGIADAHMVASRFTSQNLKIDAVFSSPAIRALHTCAIFLRELSVPFSKLQVNNELYDFSGESVFQFVENFPENIDNVLIFGHNNAFTNVVNTWGNKYIENVVTSGLVHLVFNVGTWKEISQGTTKQILFPKQLR